MTTQLTAEEREALLEQRDALTAEAKANWGDPQWRAAMAQAITDAIYWGFTHEDLLGLMTTVETTDEGGRIFVKETRGLRAFWTARGAYIEASTLHSEVFEMKPDPIGFHVYEFDQKLRNNFGETQQTLIDLGIERLSAEVNLRMLRLFEAAVPIGSAQYVSGAGVSLTAVDDAIDQVIDESRDQTITIVGRRTMVGQIATQIGTNTMFLPNTNEEILRTGVLGTYRGAQIAYLTNWKDDQDVSFFPANEMFVIGRDASKAGFWGGLENMEWTDNNWYWHYIAKREFGAIVHRPERLRRIVDTTKTP